MQQQCPGLPETELRDVMNCREKKCSQYAWDVGEWRDCVIDSGAGEPLFVSSIVDAV